MANVYTSGTGREDGGPTVTTVRGFATRTPSIPVTVDAFGTRREDGGPKVTTVQLLLGPVCWSSPLA